MVVCMERLNCVRLYEALIDLPGCPEIKIVMTGNLSEDPPEWSQKGYLTTKAQRDAIKQRMIDPDDPLKMVIVCDMWLTGTDIPCLHTLYVDKPMEGHNMIQAISRVNRVFSDKPHGLIVDYIGIGDALREATAITHRAADRARWRPALTKKPGPYSWRRSKIFMPPCHAERIMAAGGICPRSKSKTCMPLFTVTWPRRMTAATNSCRWKPGSPLLSCWSSTWMIAGRMPMKSSSTSVCASRS